MNFLFLSTLSLRRATVRRDNARRSQAISIHALLAESDVNIAQTMQDKRQISIHALLAESDKRLIEYKPVVNISIHALLAESDWSLINLAPGVIYFYPRSPCGERHSPPDSGLLLRYFYPRSPCGERRHAQVAAAGVAQFLSTLSLRRATVSVPMVA